MISNVFADDVDATNRQLSLCRSLKHLAKPMKPTLRFVVALIRVAG
ncbi:hypothetical protein RSSM_01303 [Rhodopirellula sallentina SM41]|uniref:Uncharacterized protein n=1 Tax=Rhodopirellula sallentina SM41 TaxID=1263870 RepID=M5U715_9BACT|nr:hypothetical protein RSSM_01303 [Rhodopirellula sallentina SM41]